MKLDYTGLHDGFIAAMAEIEEFLKKFVPQCGTDVSQNAAGPHPKQKRSRDSDEDDDDEDDELPSLDDEFYQSTARRYGIDLHTS